MHIFLLFFKTTLSLNYLGHRGRLSWVLLSFQTTHGSNTSKFQKAGNLSSPLIVSHFFIHLSTLTTVSDFLCHFSLLLSIQRSVHIQCIWGEFGSDVSFRYHFGLLKSSKRQFQVVLNRSPVSSEKLRVNNCLLKHHYGQVQDQEVEAGQPRKSLWTLHMRLVCDCEVFHLCAEACAGGLPMLETNVLCS